MSRSAHILRALAANASMCLDNQLEREIVADRVLAALDADADAKLVRSEFENVKGDDHIAVTRGIGGRREAALLAAAHRLAGGGQ